jgi:hypothetical protein
MYESSACERFASKMAPLGEVFLLKRLLPVTMPKPNMNSLRGSFGMPSMDRAAQTIPEMMATE